MIINGIAAFGINKSQVIVKHYYILDVDDIYGPVKSLGYMSRKLRWSECCTHMWFLQFGTILNTANATINYVKLNFDGPTISRNGSVRWPP